MELEIFFKKKSFSRKIWRWICVSRFRSVCSIYVFAESCSYVLAQPSIAKTGQIFHVLSHAAILAQRATAESMRTIETAAGKWTDFVASVHAYLLLVLRTERKKKRVVTMRIPGSSTTAGWPYINTHTHTRTHEDTRLIPLCQR